MEYDIAHEYEEKEVVVAEALNNREIPYLVGREGSGVIGIELGEIIPAGEPRNEDGTEELFWSYVANSGPKGENVNAIRLPTEVVETVCDLA